MKSLFSFLRVLNKDLFFVFESILYVFTKHYSSKKSWFIEWIAMLYRREVNRLASFFCLNNYCSVLFIAFFWAKYFGKEFFFKTPKKISQNMQHFLHLGKVRVVFVFLQKSQRRRPFLLIHYIIICLKVYCTKRQNLIKTRAKYWLNNTK
jgi:hypothetical protein